MGKKGQGKKVCPLLYGEKLLIDSIREGLLFPVLGDSTLKAFKSPGFH